MVVATIAGQALSGTAGIAFAASQPQPGGTQPVVPKFRIDLRDEVPLPQIIDLVRRDLGIQVIYLDDLSDKRVYLPAPIEIPADRVLNFLTLLLEQKGYTLVQTSLGIYTIIPRENISGDSVGRGTQSATQIVDTKGLKPSTLQGQVNIIGGLANAVYNDDLGVIVVTDSPGKIDLLRQLVDQLVLIRNEVQFIPFEIRHISATAARERVLALAGEIATNQGQMTQQQANLPPGSKQAPGLPTTSSAVVQSTSNLASQLIVDPNSNFLLFRGRPEDANYVEGLLAIVDVPNRMKSVFYEVGLRAAEVIAFQGAREGLGDVTTYQSATADTGSGINAPAQQQQQRLNPNLPFQNQQQGGLQNQPTNNSAGFVIYPDAGGFMYYGTDQQHARIGELSLSMRNLSQGDLVTMEFYKLKHAKAEDVVTIIGELIGGDGMDSGNRGSILGNDLSRRGSDRRSSRNRRNEGDTQQSGTDLNRNSSNTGINSGAGTLGAVGNDETSVIEDTKNNQVIVKTRQRLQPDFAKLIRRLDSRRPQVYVHAQIVAVTDSQSNRLAVETQILAGQFGLNTNFGLGELSEFTSRKSVDPGLTGLTAALIRSDSVPFIITAMQNNTDSRILATPQLLVDDNEPALVVSENEIPTAVRSVINDETTTSVGEPSRAGTTLEVTPQISENAVKLDIYIQQSSFTGEATETLPPPKQTNELQSLVTVPRDCTIVIGGLTFDSSTRTVLKIPLIGDIPLVGHLFRDTVTRRQNTTLYVFLTPKIMTDPAFWDVRLLTKGPAADVKLDSHNLMPDPSMTPMEIGRPLLPPPLPSEEPEQMNPVEFPPPSLPPANEPVVAPAPAAPLEKTVRP